MRLLPGGWRPVHIVIILVGSVSLTLLSFASVRINRPAVDSFLPLDMALCWLCFCVMFLILLKAVAFVTRHGADKPRITGQRMVGTAALFVASAGAAGSAAGGWRQGLVLMAYMAIASAAVAAVIGISRFVRRLYRHRNR